MEFYGYSKCSTCRNAHQYLKQLGQDTEFVDFVKAPPSEDVLRSWIAMRGEGVAPFVNTKGTRYRELGLKDKQLSEDEWVRLLSQDGKLLKRPVLVSGSTVLTGFDKAAYDSVVQGHR